MSTKDLLKSVNEELPTKPTKNTNPTNSPQRFIIDIEEIKRTARVKPTDDIAEPLPCLQKISDGQISNVCTYGNFSLAIGKAKSRKTFGTTLFMAVVTGHKNEHFMGGLPKGAKGVYFDTEQGRYHVLKLSRRICQLTGQSNPKNIEVYSLRKYSPAERLAIIEGIIYADDSIKFAVIDGIRDLITSINDEEQATMITSKLLKWTEERDMHIMAVLHQNKADNNARGHTGAELTNKAETVISISKSDDDKSISIVEAEYSRDKDFNPFAFTINIDELPEVVENWQGKQSAAKGPKQSIITELGDSNIYRLLTESFTGKPLLKFAELSIQIKLAAEKLFNKTVGNNKSGEIITYCKNNNWVTQAADKQPYTLGKFT